MKSWTQHSALFVLFSIPAGFLLADDAKDKAADSQTIKVGTSQLTVPASWKKQQTTRQFRVVQLTIPKAKDDTQEGTFIVYFFGQGGGGGVEPNLRRWKGQFADVKDPGKVEKHVVQGVKITTLDIAGTYKDRPFPGAADFTARKNYRMLTAVVETADGPYYFRMVGPRDSIATQAGAWNDMLKSLQTQ